MPIKRFFFPNELQSSKTKNKNELTTAALRKIRKFYATEYQGRRGMLKNYANK